MSVNIRLEMAGGINGLLCCSPEDLCGYQVRCVLVVCLPGIYIHKRPDMQLENAPSTF